MYETITYNITKIYIKVNYTLRLNLGIIDVIYYINLLKLSMFRLI